jgi:hypothetical protein
VRRTIEAFSTCNSSPGVRAATIRQLRELAERGVLMVFRVDFDRDGNSGVQDRVARNDRNTTSAWPRTTDSTMALPGTVV